MREYRRHESLLPSVSPIFRLPFENFTKLLARPELTYYALFVNPFSLAGTR
jgi:hypothetical protein